MKSNKYEFKSYSFGFKVSKKLLARDIGCKVNEVTPKRVYKYLYNLYTWVWNRMNTTGVGDNETYS